MCSTLLPKRINHHQAIIATMPPTSGLYTCKNNKSIKMFRARIQEQNSLVKHFEDMRLCRPSKEYFQVTKTYKNPSQSHTYSSNLSNLHSSLQALISLTDDLSLLSNMAALESCHRAQHDAILKNPVVSTTFVEQFWTSAKSKTINNVRNITAKVAGKVVSISEASIRTDLIFDDADGIDSLPNQAIFNAIQLMGYERDLTGKHFSGKITPLFDNMLVQPTQEEGASSERLSEAQPSPSPTPTSEAPNESLPDSSSAQPSEVPFEQQSDLSPSPSHRPSPQPSPTPIIPDSIPEHTGENLGDHSSNDQSLSGNEDAMTLQNVYDLCISLCKQVSVQAKEIKLLKAKISKLKKKATPVIKHFKAYQKNLKGAKTTEEASLKEKEGTARVCIQTREEECKRRCSSGVHTLMTNEGVVIHICYKRRVILKEGIVVQMLNLKLESEEESTMALELIRFIKKGNQLTLLLGEELASPNTNDEIIYPRANATGKGKSNPLMAGKFAKNYKANLDTRIKLRKKYTSDKSFTLGYTEAVDNVNILQSCNGLLLCTDYAHDDSNFYGCAGLRLAFDPTKSPDYKVSLVMGEREEDSFLVMNLSGKVVQYNLISKTLSEIYDMGSNEVADDYLHGFIPPFAMYDMGYKKHDHKVYEFIPSSASV
ncbi:hypothetical protein Tco_0700196 [Tanacetum coccineum]